MTMANSESWFDQDNFVNVVNRTRIARGQSWREVAIETGLSSSTMTRLQQGHVPDLKTFALLASWAGANPNEFLPSPREGLPNTARMITRIGRALRDEPALAIEDVHLIENVVAVLYGRLTAK